jgi:hypothetical protein
VRGRVLALPNVSLRRGAVAGPMVLPGRRAVAGVRLASGEEERADLVLDASGRAACSLRWFELLGATPPPTSQVHIDMGYATRTLRRDPADDRGWLLGVVIGSPPAVRLGIAVALEGGRWIVTLAGFHGDHPPTDDAGWLAFARRLPDPAIADLIASCEPAGDIAAYRMASSVRRHVEHLSAPPAGLGLIGDAVASFNPIYAQGMTSAAMQAEALATSLDRRPELDARFVRAYHRAVGRAVDVPWRMSVTADFAMPGTTGPKPAGAGLSSRYMGRVLQATHSDAVVAQRFIDVANLLRPPAALLSPGICLRVLRATGSASGRVSRGGPWRRGLPSPASPASGRPSSPDLPSSPEGPSSPDLPSSPVVPSPVPPQAHPRWGPARQRSA